MADKTSPESIVSNITGAKFKRPFEEINFFHQAQKKLKEEHK